MQFTGKEIDLHFRRLHLEKRTISEKTKNRILSAFGVVTISFIAFLVFARMTKKDINNQNRKFAMETTRKTAEYIDDTLTAAVNAMNNYAFYFSSTLQGKHFTRKNLDDVKDYGGLDAFIFADSQGTCMSSDDYFYPTVGEDWYENGMRGTNGIAVFRNESLISANRICFYAPIEGTDGYMGVLLGMSNAEAFFKGLLTLDFFGEQSPTFVVDNNGNIIAGSAGTPIEGKIGEFLVNSKLISRDIANSIEFYLTKNEQTVIRAIDSNEVSNITVVRLTNNSDFNIVQMFPKAATETMSGVTTRNALILVIVLALLAAAFITIIILRDTQDAKRMAAENKELNYILVSTKKQVKSFVLVDTVTQKFKILYSSETINIGQINQIASAGYDAVLERLLKFVKNDEQRAQLMTKLKMSALLDELGKRRGSNLNFSVKLEPDDNEIWESITVCPVERADDGSYTKILITNVDITNIASNEIAYQKKIQTALEEAERANKAKSEFLANMSHEIRTPLNSIIGFNSLIAEEDVNETVRDYSKDIANSGEILLSLISDILDLSKIEAGKMELVEEEYNLKNIVNDCYKMTLPRIGGKDIKFTTECDIASENLYGDGLRVRQIMMNLLSNAAKYTEKGEIVLRVRTDSTGNCTTGLHVSVSDTGPGISRENQQILFKAFQRISEEKNHYIEGTGLGLSLVKRLLDLMGGTIRIDSHVGLGSTFSVFIPQRVAQREISGDKINGEDEISTDELLSFRAPDARVLSVDDILLNRKLIEKLLEKSEAKVDSAKGGVEALEFLERNEYDVVFVDHMMPDMDGVEMLKRFKSTEHEKNMNTPFIILTANAVKGVKEEYLGYGFDGYLSKPTSQIELFRALKQSYEKKHGNS